MFSFPPVVSPAPTLEASWMSPRSSLSEKGNLPLRQIDTHTHCDNSSHVPGKLLLPPFTCLPFLWTGLFVFQMSLIKARCVQVFVIHCDCHSTGCVTCYG